MHAGACQPQVRRRRRLELCARPRELPCGGRDARGRSRDDLDLRCGQLELEARIAVQPAEQLRRARREIERLGVEHHQLLLEADEQRLGAGAAPAQRRSVEDGFVVLGDR